MNDKSWLNKILDEASKDVSEWPQWLRDRRQNVRCAASGNAANGKLVSEGSRENQKDSE